MVENVALQPSPPASEVGGCQAHPFGENPVGSTRSRSHRRWFVPVTLATLVGGFATVAATLGGPQALRSASSPAVAVRTVGLRQAHSIATSATASAARTTSTSTPAVPTTSHTAPVVPIASVSSASTAHTPATALASPVARKAVGPPSTSTHLSAHSSQAIVAVSEPPVATLVAEVEAAGIEPGSTWSW